MKRQINPMDVAYQVNRRKACDLCFYKKIKCDMAKPSCSNCITYKADCHTTTVRKKFAPGRAKRKELVKSLPESDRKTPQPKNEETSRIDGVESRLAFIEQQMSQVLATSSTPNGADLSQVPRAPTRTVPLQLPPSDEFLPDFDHIVLDDVNQLLTQQYSTLNQGIDPHKLDDQYALNSGIIDIDSVSIGYMTSEYPPLPPLSDIQPAISDYFANFNSLIPLFSETEFSRMLHSYYSSSCRYPRVAWAAINVVLALATRLPVSPSNAIDLGSGDVQVAKYVNNAQSVLSELVTHDADHLGLQVVLGLVMVFHAMKDSRPAVVLAGTAVRLAQRLRLHLREPDDRLSSNQVVQRNRVFWITYLFDKDICLRHHTPSAQADADIDVELPPEHPEDGAGVIYTKEGDTSINFFRLRIGLAHIQGRVYDLLFATQATKITECERRARVVFLHNQLEHWRRKLPTGMQAEAIVDHVVARPALFWLCMMHFSYLGCLVMIHGIWSHDAEWRKRLTVGFDDESSAHESHGDSRPEPPPLPRGWRNCVQMSRQCMSLIYRMPLSDCSVWANGCAYFSALIILEANIFEFPVADTVDSDLGLTSFAVKVLNIMSDSSTIMAMKRMNIVASEMDRRARLVVDASRRSTISSDHKSTLPTNRPFAGFEKLEDQQAHTNRLAAGDVKWDWGDSGVEAWPRMDFAIKEETTNPGQGDEIFRVGLGPFSEWSVDGEVNSFLDTGFLYEP